MNLFDINRIITPVKNSILRLVGRAILEAITGSDKTITIQVTGLNGETISEMEYMQNYGFTSVPEVSETTEALCVFQGGCRDQGVALVVQDRELRPTDLSDGEVCMYDGNDNRITIKTGDLIKILANSGGRIEISAGGTLEFAPLASKIKQQLDTLIDVFNAHQHSGVMAGGGNTGAPTAPQVKPNQSAFESSEVKIA